MKSNPIEKGIQVSPASGIPTGFIDAAKLGRGLNAVFKGYALIFEAMAEQAELLGVEPMVKGVKDSEAASETATSRDPSPKTVVPNTGSEGESSSDEEKLPWEKQPDDADAEAKAAAKETVSQPAVITADDLLKVAAQKITTNRKNSPKIKSLLTSYGCGAISQLPEDKREAFLNDLAQL